MKDIIDNYNNVLNDIFGVKRVLCDLCHDDIDFVIRSYEREILKAIIEYYKETYNLYWTFRESIYGKYIIIKTSEILNNCKDPSFDNFEKYYKSAYLSRINLILETTTNIEKISQISEIISKNSNIFDADQVNFVKYKEIRDQINNL